MEANLTTQAWTEPLLSLFLRRGRVTGVGPEPVPKIRDVGFEIGGHDYTLWGKKLAARSRDLKVSRMSPVVLRSVQ